MSLSDPRIVYGIHSLAPYNRSTYEPYGILKVLGGGTISLTAETEDLFGGSNKFAWASEAKTIDSSFTATVKSMPDFLFELYLGASVSTTAASATGTVGAIANKYGTSVVSATTGIASVAATAADEGDLKYGTYIVKAVSSNTVDVYVSTDIDFKSGTDVDYENDLLKVTASPITIPDSGATVTMGGSFGIEFTGGSGTVSMTIGDTAYFKVAKAHGGISDISIGESGTTFPEHGLILMAAKRSDGSLFEIEAFKAVGAGFPIALEETVFSVPELTVKLLYDSAIGKVAVIRAVSGT